MVNTPSEAVASPGTGALPMSPCDQPMGSPELAPGAATAATLTLSNVAVALMPATWLDTASPTRTVCPIANVSDATSVQATPSADSYPLRVVPARVSLTQRGAVDWLPVVLVVTPPSATRRWNGTPFSGDAATSMNPCAAEEDAEFLIITPAFVQLFTFWIEETRATIEPSPWSER